MEQTAVRMETSMKERIRKFQEKFKKETRAEIGFADAVRTLINRQLDREGIK